MIDERCRWCSHLFIPYIFCERNGHNIDYDKSEGTCRLNKSIYRHNVLFYGYCYPDFCEKGSKEYSYTK